MIGGSLRSSMGVAVLVAQSVGLAATDAPEVFRDGFDKPGAWRSGETSGRAEVVDVPGGKALRWTLRTAAQPSGRIYTLQRDLPKVAWSGAVLEFDVTSNRPAALEVQLTGRGERRVYHIVDLKAKRSHVRLPIREMTPFAGFSDADWRGPLRLRLWIDDRPNWANGTIKPDTEYVFSIRGLRATNPLAGLPPGCTAAIRVEASKVTGEIHPHVYGQFLEHIYHSVVDGLWGEQVRNRSFYDEIEWALAGDVVRQRSYRTPARLLIGEATWADYEVSLKARRVTGHEGFLITVRHRDDKNWCWWNLGGWGNVRHALEVCANGTKGVVGDQAPGQIAYGRWYDLRIRCEGDRITGWLDGKKLLDVKGVSHRRGCIGLGTWATHADFKDVVVKDLTGKVLFEGAPKLPDGADAPKHWQAYGEVGAPPGLDMVENDGRNTGRCLAISPVDEDWAGIAQERFYVQKGLTYTVQIRLQPRGAVEHKVQLRASGDGAVLAEATFNVRYAGRTVAWPIYDLELKPARTDENARLVIAARSPRAWQIDFVSMTSSEARANGGFRPDLLGAVKALSPPIIRWPGGCFASIYRWKRSIGPQHERQPFYNRPWGYWDSGCFGIDEFVRLCCVVGAEPLVVLNLGSWDSPEAWKTYLTEALEWIEYCNGSADTPMGALRAKNGHPEPYNITHWELDNETWGMKVDGYIDRFKPFVKEIRRRWPNVTLYACTFWEKGDPHLLDRAARDFDLISYHLYDDPNRYASGPKRHEAVWRRYVPMIASSANPKIKLGVTEWNAQSTDWRTGLFCGGLLNVFERLDVVQMATPALFIRRVDATAWDNAFINHDHVRWFGAPNYVVMKLYREHYQPKRVAHTAVGGLDVMATRSDDGRTLVLKVVNTSDDAVKTQIDLGSFKPKRAEARVVTASDLQQRNTLEEPHHIAPKSTGVPAGSTAFYHTFPQLSVTVIRAEQ